MQFTLERSAFDQFRGDALGLRAEPGLDAAQIGCLIGEKRRTRADGISGSPLLPSALARSRASPVGVPLTTKSP